MSHEIVLETKRLFLRRFTSEDAPLIEELDGDPEVMRYLTKGAPTPCKVIEEEILPRWLAYYGAEQGIGFWAAHERASGAFVGWFHLKPDRQVSGWLELGYRLRRSVWGKGYATELSAALVERAFSEMGAPGVSALTLVGNAASRRVMEKVGLRFECEFLLEEALRPDWTEEERRAVRYSLGRGAYFDRRPPDEESGRRTKR